MFTAEWAKQPRFNHPPESLNAAVFALFCFGSTAGFPEVHPALTLTEPGELRQWSRLLSHSPEVLRSVAEELRQRDADLGAGFVAWRRSALLGSAELAEEALEASSQCPALRGLALAELARQERHPIPFLQQAHELLTGQGEILPLWWLTARAKANREIQDVEKAELDWQDAGRQFRKAGSSGGGWNVNCTMPSFSTTYSNLARPAHCWSPSRLAPRTLSHSKTKFEILFSPLWANPGPVGLWTMVLHWTTPLGTSVRELHAGIVIKRRERFNKRRNSVELQGRDSVCWPNARNGSLGSGRQPRSTDG